MIEKNRRAAARKFRALLTLGVIRRDAFVQVRKEFGVSRRTVYRYCARYGVSTR